MDSDIDIVREAIADDDMHALHHVENTDEHGDLWNELEAQQKQIDMLFEKLRKLGL